LALRALAAAIIWFALCAIAVAGSSGNAVPYIDLPLLPTGVAPGSAGFTMTINGAGFAPTSVVNWNGSPRSTTFVSSAQLTASIPASDVATIGTVSITVSSPAPGGGVSNVIFFSVKGPVKRVAMRAKGTCSEYPLVATGDFDGDGNTDIANDR